MQVRWAVDHHHIVAVADVGQEVAQGHLERPVGQVRVGDVETGGEPAAGQEVDVRYLGGPDDLVGDRLLLIDGRDRLGRVEMAGHLGPEEALREARLGVVVDQEHTPAGLGQRARKVVAGRGFADPALLVQGRDNGHAIPLSRSWITPKYRQGYTPCISLSGEMGLGDCWQGPLNWVAGVWKGVIRRV